jgi:hypothetical protein
MLKEVSAGGGTSISDVNGSTTHPSQMGSSTSTRLILREAVLRVASVLQWSGYKTTQRLAWIKPEGRIHTNQLECGRLTTYPLEVKTVLETIIKAKNKKKLET